MSKRPTLKEVKKHFDNAKEVKCLEGNDVVNISENVISKIHPWYNGFWIDLDEDFYKGGSVHLWDGVKGYAEIIAYKEKTYSLTADQLRSLTDPKVKQWFPEVFKTVLEVGKWYRGKAASKGYWLFCFNGSFDKKGYPCGFGFDTDKNYKYKDQSWGDEVIEATEAEVFEALKNEAIKRGVVKGASHTIFVREEKKEYRNIVTYESTRYGYNKNNNTFMVNNWCVFDNGQWCEIVKTFSKKEAQEILKGYIL